jgi:hypothetical protein
MVAKSERETPEKIEMMTTTAELAMRPTAIHRITDPESWKAAAGFPRPEDMP